MVLNKNLSGFFILQCGFGGIVKIAAGQDEHKSNYGQGQEDAGHHSRPDRYHKVCMYLHSFSKKKTLVSF